MEKSGPSSKLRGTQKPLSCEGQSGLLPPRKEAAFDSCCILKPAGTASHSKARHCKHGFTQNPAFLVAMRTDLAA